MKGGDDIAIWLVEDDAEYRQTILYVMEHTTGVDVSACFGSFESLQAAIISGERVLPNVILMDIGLPKANGLVGARWVKENVEDVPVIMLTVQDAAETIFSALKAGASGYILKDTPIDRLTAAIREAARGGTLMPAPVASKVLGYFSDGQEERFGLTTREKEVLALMTEGLSHAMIAERLFLSAHTVDNHLRGVYRKLHLKSGIQAVVKALRAGLV